MNFIFAVNHLIQLHNYNYSKGLLNLIKHDIFNHLFFFKKMPIILHKLIVKIFLHVIQNSIKTIQINANLVSN